MDERSASFQHTYSYVQPWQMIKLNNTLSIVERSAKFNDYNMNRQDCSIVAATKPASIEKLCAEHIEVVDSTNLPPQQFNYDVRTIDGCILYRNVGNQNQSLFQFLIIQSCEIL